MLKQEILDVVDPLVVKRLAAAGEDAEHTFERRFKERKKSAIVAFILSLFGLHRFYYGQIGLGVLMLFTLMLGGIGLIWIIVDWFTMRKWIRNYNDDLAMDIMRQVAPQ